VVMADYGRSTSMRERLKLGAVLALSWVCVGLFIYGWLSVVSGPRQFVGCPDIDAATGACLSHDTYAD
jgi:hypothetical protein